MCVYHKKKLYHMPKATSCKCLRGFTVKTSPSQNIPKSKLSHVLQLKSNIIQIYYKQTDITLL